MIEEKLMRIFNSYSYKKRLEIVDEILDFSRNIIKDNIPMNEVKNITFGSEDKWCNNISGLYLNIKVFCSKNKYDDIILNINGDIVRSYMTCLDTGLDLKYYKFEIPLTYNSKNKSISKEKYLTLSVCTFLLPVFFWIIFVYLYKQIFAY